MTSTARTALLGSALTASIFAAAAPASAQCAVATGSVTCATTTTTDTTYPTNPPRDRHYLADTSAGAFTGTVSTGAVVNGSGLAITNTVGGANNLTVANNGSVALGAIPATQGGNAALDISATGATNVVYTGNGSVTNASGQGAGLLIDTNGTGSINATVGGNVTTNGADYGIQLIGGGGTGGFTLGTAAGTTISGGFGGIRATTSSTGNVAVTNAATIASSGVPGTASFGVVAENVGTGNTSIVNSGNVGSAADRMAVAGLWAVQGTGAGTLTVNNSTGNVYGATGIFATSGSSFLSTVTTGAGVVNGTNFGIDANQTGTGALTVTTGTGAVSASAAAGVGIDAAGGAGAVTINAGGATTGGAFGIQAASTGTQSITANGVTTGTATAGIHSNSTGARTITVGAAGNVTGGAQAILLSNTGAAAINNAGVIGGASTGLAVNNTGTGAVTLANTGTVNGRVTFNAGNDLFTNNGTFSTQGVSDFGAGTDTLNNGGTINLLGATTFANLENFSNTGTVNFNSNVLTGTGGTFTNAGTINTTGNAGVAGYTAFSNSGTMNLAAGTFVAPTGPFTNSGTINATGGNTSITGQTSFANSGTLNLQDGATNDVLTINSSFVGSGNSRLLIDAGGTASDRLVINGAASGLTSVNVANVGGPIIDPTGLLVVDTLSSSANAFVLGANPSTPLVAYQLEQRGADYYLTSGATAAAFEPLTFGLIGQDLWYQSADKYRDMAAGRRGADVSRHNGFGMWADVYASRDRYGDNNNQYTLSGVNYSVNNRVHNHRAGGQIGADYAPGSGPFLVGLTAGYERNKASLDASASDYEAEGYNIGAYAQYAPVTGFYAGFLAKYDSANLDLNNSVFGLGGTSSPKLKSMGYDGEVGYRFGTDAMSFDVNAGLSHVRSKVENFAFGGFGYDFDKITSNRGRIGVRAGFGGGLGAYVGAKLLHEFKGDSDVFFLNGSNRYDLANQAHGTWGRVEAGLDGGRDGGFTTGVWADVGDVKGFGAKVGFRF